MHHPQTRLSAPILVLNVLALLALTGPARSHFPGEHDPAHIRNPKHPAALDGTRFTTSREALPLPLPAEKDAFFFVIFGDRTGGPPEGIEVLAQAVRDVNLLEPDLVMTVGDLVQGYNAREPWMKQMRQFKATMDDLLMPWFPVPGNHDIYWRGPDKPVGEHERDFEKHFGPLWYAFEHKHCWFIVLYSDEGDSDTGEKTFDKPAAQQMSPEQFTWLRETLEQAADADHIFLFLHHPRWLRGGYGDDWDRVHDLLASAGNVSAVFAGHIHKMRYDGPRDGIEYVTLATTGGAQSARAPRAGYLHHFHIVTVRKNQLAMAAVPVGEVMDVRAITGEVSNETAQLASLRPLVSDSLPVASDGSVDATVHATITNPVGRPIELTLLPDSRDSRWGFAPDHKHCVIDPGDSHGFAFRVWRDEHSLDAAFRPLTLALQTDYLAEGCRFTIPETTMDVPLRVDLRRPPTPEREAVLSLDGENDCLKVPSDRLDLPDGPLTLECWFNAVEYGKRTGLVAKTENSEYGFFVSNGVPAFFIFLGDSYVELQTDEPVLRTDKWHHIAGVYDGRESRLYLDGRLIKAAERSGKRRTNTFPLLIGADVNGRGEAVSFFRGCIDAVRLSPVARYEGDHFTPRRRFSPDPETALLLNMDGSVGPWLYDESPSAAHPITVGSPQVRVPPDN